MQAQEVPINKRVNNSYKNTTTYKNVQLNGSSKHNNDDIHQEWI
jgi:hypothetical protein